MSVCIFCLTHESRNIAWCSYGMKHEYPEPEKPKKQAAKVDRNLCIKCGLHTKNPASLASGCAHEYPPKEE